MQQLLDEIAAGIQRVYREAVDPVGQKFSFEARPEGGEIQGAPLVLFLGNHSSGKSTFINHLIGGTVQKTGLAPTDDAFTILTQGKAEEERDGQALVSNAELPYGGLRHFGAELLSHLRLKVRPSEFLREVTLVDSPGMIDSAAGGAGRGYDFTGVARWFAERADVVLIFFDPDKPGTTGETLQVFTEALQGIDHKLLIVMNKVDRFQGLQDFARAYGALCWNLGKVIPRKDLPHIYTTFIPVPGEAPSGLPTKDFDSQREELVREIRRAPARRVDNLITRAHGHAERLLMHARILDEAARDLRRFRLKLWGLLSVMVLFGALAGGLSIAFKAEAWVSACIFAAAGLVGYGGYFAVQGLVRGQERQGIAGLPAIFERIYVRELLVRERVEDLKGLWDAVHPRARRTLEKLGTLSLRRLRAAEFDRLKRALDVELPEMRSKLHRELGVRPR